MKYVKLQNCRLKQDDFFIASETSHKNGEAGEKGGKAYNKVTTKFVEAMERVIMARDQRQRKAPLVIDCVSREGGRIE
ncbi:hypothetical protein Tsubulata_047671 [Turnera subulata]|uniref:Uncharacterized protein n=1 Tax=Turnera subulata TaxID=218843 RepID=A0A9Q0FPZ0_9ROSI|nr:hypothetical protein Tsubulata_047671 [Turnera subulata]